MTFFLLVNSVINMRKLKYLLSCFLFTSLVCADLIHPALGDVLKLKSGGRAEGVLLNPEEKPRTKFVMRLDSGGEVTFNAGQVEEHRPLTAAQKDYRWHLSQMPATAKANWILADWCRDNGLRAERSLHLEAAIQLDPGHEKARRALGYEKLGGEWIKRKDFMTQRGFVLHEGRWRLPQDVEISKKRRETDLAKKKWALDIKKWRGWLGKRKHDEAINGFRSINDPLAAPALADALSEERVPEVRHIYVAALAKLKTTASTKALVEVVLTAGDRERDLRDKALTGLERNGRDLAVDAFIHALGNKDNTIVRRAGFALQQMPEDRSTRPLVDALRTKHTYKTGNDNPGQLSTSFGSGGTGLSTGGGRPKTRTKVVENREVLDALLAITEGAHTEFQFNQDLWRRWLATRDLPPVLDLRRGS